MGLSKSNSKREVYSDTIIPQETRKALTRQPNSTPKAAGKRKKKKKTKSVEGRRDHKNQSRNK